MLVSLPEKSFPTGLSTVLQLVKAQRTQYLFLSGYKIQMRKNERLNVTNAKPHWGSNLHSQNYCILILLSLKTITRAYQKYFTEFTFQIYTEHISFRSLLRTCKSWVRHSRFDAICTCWWQTLHQQHQSLLSRGNLNNDEKHLATGAGEIRLCCTLWASVSWQKHPSAAVAGR